MTAGCAQAIRDGQAWAAVEDGQVVGFAIVIAQPGYLLLDNVAVLPAAQGRGIGVRLLMLAEEQARGLGLDEIRLYTNEAMTENLAYYPRHGYAESPPAAIEINNRRQIADSRGRAGSERVVRRCAREPAAGAASLSHRGGTDGRA
jgi:ribosomal protein S18 acetylase RimI-like enzyme